MPFLRRTLLVIGLLLELSLLGQGQVPHGRSTELRRTANGIRWVRREGPLQPPNRMALDGLSLWNHSDQGRAYIPTSVAEADRGASLLVGQSLNLERFQLFSATAIGAVEPVWLDSRPAPAAGDLIVAAAATADRLVGLSHRDDPNGGWVAEIRAYRSRAATPDWTVILRPPAKTVISRLAVSDEGHKVIVARSDPGNQRARVVVLAGHTGQLLFETWLSEPDVRGLAISSNGHRIYVASSSHSLVLDGIDGRVLFRTPNTGGFESHAFSSDGTLLAYGGVNTVTLLRDLANDGSFTLWARETFPGTAFATAADFSSDGRFFAWTDVHYDTYRTYDVCSYDVDGRRLLFRKTYHAAGRAQDVPRRIRFAAERDRFIVGGWGDEAGAHAEVHIFDALDPNPVFEIDTPGSAFDVALDATGTKATVVSKSVHANQLGSGGEVTCEVVRELALELQGVPRPGTALQVTAQAPPRTEVILFLSYGERGPAMLPGCGGLLWLDPGSAILIGARVVPAGGQSSWSITVPTNAWSLIGTRITGQALATDEAGHCLLSNPVFSRILP
ncbi:MAG: WD40 repeat domain-containing protein [Planctomycetota bacterium]